MYAETSQTVGLMKLEVGEICILRVVRISPEFTTSGNSFGLRYVFLSCHIIGDSNLSFSQYSPACRFFSLHVSDASVSNLSPDF